MIVDETYARQLMTDVTRAVWREGETSALNDFFHPTARIAGVLPQTELTVEDYRVLAEQLRLVIEVRDFEIMDCVCGADGHVAYRMMLDSVVVATGAAAPQDFANFCVFEGDKVVHSTVLTDQLSFFERAGLIDPNQRFMLLAG